MLPLSFLPIGSSVTDANGDSLDAVFAAAYHQRPTVAVSCWCSAKWKHKKVTRIHQNNQKQSPESILSPMTVSYSYSQMVQLKVKP